MSAYGRSGARQPAAGERPTVCPVSSTPVIGRLTPRSSRYRTVPTGFRAPIPAPACCGRPDSKPRGPGWMEGMPSYDAFLLVSFGGPEGPDDVMPFLENVTRGRGVPPERLASVAEHYYAFGGVSPINQQCRDLLAAVRADFAASGLSLPAVLGEPELDAVPDRHGARHGRGRRAAGRRVRHLRLQLLLELPAVPGRHRAGPRRRRPRRSADRQDQALLQPPGLHRAVRRQRARGAGHAPRRGARATPTWCSPPTASRARWPRRAGPAGRADGTWPS